MAQGWTGNRVHKQTSCPCEHCCKSSNICNFCKDWSAPINWKWETSNPPNIRCNKCTNSYHEKCLPFLKRKANSWQSCSDIGRKCSKYLDFFSFVHEMNNNKQAAKYENLIQEKYNEIYPNKKLKITAHFCGFHYNKWTYFIQDCAEILLNGEPPAIGRIIDIFLTDQNESYALIDWYQYSQRSENELLLSNASDGNGNGLDVIQIDRINVKVAVLDSFEEYKSAVKKRDRSIREKTESMKIQNNFGKECLFDKSIQFDKIFYSLSGNGNDSNKTRMAMQNEILTQNRKQKANNNNNRKRKREFDEVSKIQQIQKTQKTKKRKVSSIVPREEYDELLGANEKLKAEIARSKKHEHEVLLLQKSNAKFKNKIEICEKHKQTLVTQLVALKKEKEALYAEGKLKRATLRSEHAKKMLVFQNTISELEKENVKLEKTLRSKNSTIDFYRHARDAERNKNNANANDIIAQAVPYHITPIHGPIDPRLNRQNSNAN